MNLFRLGFRLSALLPLLLPGASVFAQAHAAEIATPGSPPASATESAGVNVAGRHLALHLPDAARVRFRIFAEGKNNESALRKLLAARAAVARRLGKITGDAPKSTFSEPMLLQERPANPMARMQVMMMGGEREKPDTSLIRVSMSIDLEWPLNEKSIEPMHRRIDEFRRQLKLLDLPSDDKDTKDEDAADASDEKADAASQPADSAGARIRVSIPPTFFYVKHVSQDESQAAAAAAFADARAAAERLARAAGLQLGALRSLSEGDLTARPDLSTQQAAATELMSDMFSGGSPRFGDEADRPKNELVTSDLRPIKQETCVTAAFSLK